MSYIGELAKVILKIIKVLLPGLAFACAAHSLSAADRTSLVPPDSAFSALQWRSIGPFRGGRAVATEGPNAAPLQRAEGTVRRNEGGSIGGRQAVSGARKCK